MDEPGITGFTRRQITGFDYVQYTESLSPEIQKSRTGKEFWYSLHGKAKVPPEIEALDFTDKGVGAVVIYHDLESFVIKSARSNKKLDLVAITPPGWSQKVIELTSAIENAPEVHRAFGQYQNVDVPNKECVISSGRGLLDPEDADTAVKEAVWNTLLARFIDEIGEPANSQATEGMRTSILQRRNEVFAAFDKKSKVGPEQAALKSFKN